MKPTVAVLTVILLLGCAGIIKPPAPPTVAAPVAQGVQPTTEQERVALAVILDKADDPTSVDVAEFGPHRLVPDADKMTGIRIRYRAKNKQGALQVYDSIVWFQDGKSVGPTPNAGGAHWTK